MKCNKNTLIYVIGHAQHGKTTVARCLAGMLDCSYADSSLWMADKVVRPYLAEKFDVHYETVEEAHRDRYKWREEWKASIAAYNAEDPAKLSREIFFENRIYCGCRTLAEYTAGRHELGAVSIFVDAYERSGELERGLEISPADCDYTLNNNEDWYYTIARIHTFVNNYNLLGVHNR